MDMRTYGKEFERYYDRAQNETGVRFIRSRIHSIEAAAPGVPISLKWPNDVWWHGRKLGGILLESGGNPGDFHVVAGVGLNLAMPPQFGAAIDQPWVDLREILGTVDIARNRLAARRRDFLVCGSSGNQGG